MPAAPSENKNAKQGGAPDRGTADTGRVRGRALVVPTLLLFLGGISYGGIFSANKLAAGVSFRSSRIRSGSRCSPASRC